MKKFVIGLLVLVAIFCGFVGVLALARAFNNTFDWHMNLVFPQVLFLIPLVRFPGFIWLIATGFLLPKAVHQRLRPAEMRA